MIVIVAIACVAVIGAVVYFAVEVKRACDLPDEPDVDPFDFEWPQRKPGGGWVA